MKIIKQTLKKSYFWFLLITLVLGLVLLINFSNKVVYGAEYLYKYNLGGGTFTTGALKLNRDGTAEQYGKYNDDYRKYTYLINGDYIYLYDHTAESGGYSYRLKVSDKFTIRQDAEGSELMVADDAKIAFYTILSFNLIFATATVVQITREVIKVKKSQNKVENDQQ